MDVYERARRMEKEVREEATEKLKALEAATAANYRTPDQLRVMKTSELVARIAIFSVEVATYQANLEDIGLMEKEDPEGHASTIRMVNAAAKDLAMSSHELDLRVPNRESWNDDIG